MFPTTFQSMKKFEEYSTRLAELNVTLNAKIIFLKKKYQKCDYYQSELKFNKQTKTQLQLTCNKPYLCKVCNYQHKKCKAYLEMSKDGSCYIHCMKNTKLIYRSASSKEKLREKQITNIKSKPRQFLLCSTG